MRRCPRSLTTVRARPRTAAGSLRTHACLSGSLQAPRGAGGAGSGAIFSFKGQCNTSCYNRLMRALAREGASQEAEASKTQAAFQSKPGTRKETHQRGAHGAREATGQAGGAASAGPRGGDVSAVRAESAGWTPGGQGQAGCPRTAGCPASSWGVAGSYMTPTRPRDTRQAFPAQQRGRPSKTTNAVGQGARHPRPAQGFPQRACHVSSEGPLSLVTLTSTRAHRREGEAGGLRRRLLSRPTTFFLETRPW